MGILVIDDRFNEKAGEHEFLVNWGPTQAWLTESNLDDEEQAALKDYWQEKEDRRNGKPPKSTRKRVRSARKKSSRKKKRAKVESASSIETPAKKIKLSHSLISPSPQSKDVVLHTPAPPRKPIPLCTPSPNPSKQNDLDSPKQVPQSPLPSDRDESEKDMKMHDIDDDAVEMPPSRSHNERDDSALENAARNEDGAEELQQSLGAGSHDPESSEDAKQADIPRETKTTSVDFVEEDEGGPKEFEVEDAGACSENDAGSAKGKGLASDPDLSISHSVFVETVSGSGKGAELVAPTAAGAGLVAAPVATPNTLPSLQLSPITPKKPETDSSESSQYVLQSAKSRCMANAVKASREGAVAADNSMSGLSSLLGAPPPLESPESPGFKSPLPARGGHRQQLKVHADAISLTDADSSSKTPPRLVKAEPKSPAPQDFFQFPDNAAAPMADIKPDIKLDIRSLVKHERGLTTPMVKRERSTPMTLRSMGKAEKYAPLFSKESLSVNKVLRRKRRREASQRQSAANPKLAAKAAAAKMNAIVIADDAASEAAPTAAKGRGKRKGRKSTKKPPAKRRRTSRRRSVAVAVKEEKLSEASDVEYESHLGADNESSMLGLVDAQSAADDDSELLGGLHSRPAKKRRRTVAAVSHSRSRKRHAATGKSPRSKNTRKRARVTAEQEVLGQPLDIRQPSPTNFNITATGAIDLTDDSSEIKEQAPVAPSHAHDSLHLSSDVAHSGDSRHSPKQPNKADSLLLRPEAQQLGGVPSPSSVSRAEGEPPQVTAAAAHQDPAPQTPQVSGINEGVSAVGVLETPDVSRNLRNEFNVVESPIDEQRVAVGVVMAPEHGDRRGGRVEEGPSTEGEDVHDELERRRENDFLPKDEEDAASMESDTVGEGVSLGGALSQRRGKLVFSISLSLMLGFLLDFFALTADSSPTDLKLPQLSWETYLAASLAVQIVSTVSLHSTLSGIKVTRGARFTFVQNASHTMFVVAALLSLALVPPQPKAGPLPMRRALGRGSVPKDEESHLVAVALGYCTVSLLANLPSKMPLQKRLRDLFRVFISAMCLARAHYAATPLPTPAMPGDDRHHQQQLHFLPSDSQVLHALTLTFGVQASLVAWQVLAFLFTSVCRRSPSTNHDTGHSSGTSDPLQTTTTQFFAVLLSTVAAILSSADSSKPRNAGAAGLRATFSQAFGPGGAGKPIVCGVSFVLVFAGVLSGVVACMRAILRASSNKKRRSHILALLSVVIMLSCVGVSYLYSCVSQDPVFHSAVSDTIRSAQNMVESLDRQSLVLLVLSDGLASGLANPE